MDKQIVTLGDGCRIAYRWDGPSTAPTLLLSNSLGTDMAMWEPQITAFAQHYRVLRYDSRGHGASDSPAGGYSMDRLGRDAVELLDGLGVDIVDFCGLSKGGMVGQWLAHRAPERLRRVVLANTSAYMGPPANWQQRIDGVLEKGMEGLADASISRWFTPQFQAARPEAIAPIRTMLLACDPAGYAGCCAAIRDMDQRPTAKLNRVKTLVIAGINDPSTSVADADMLTRSALDGRLLTLEAAHLSNIERPEAFASAVLDFLT